jgi:putative inorganic carbon (hco3(-)) transporter
MSWPRKILIFSYYALVVSVPLVFLPTTSELFEFNKMILTYLFSLLIAFSWLAQSVINRKFTFRRTLLDWPLIIFLAIQLISLFFSIDIRTSWLGYYSRFNGGLASLACYALLYWAAVSNLDRRHALSLLKVTLFTAIPISLWGIAEHFGIDSKWWVQDVRTRIFSTLGQPNWLAAYLLALIFVPLSSLIFSAPASKSGSRPIPWLKIGIAVLLFITFIFTKSRSGLLAFAISSAVFLGFSFLFLRDTRRSWLKWLIPVYIGLGIFVLVSDNPVTELLYQKTTPVSTAPAGPALEVGGTQSVVIRKIVWAGAISIWQSSSKSFWLGSGPETFAMAYYQHRPLEHNNTSEWELLYNKAHNEFLNYLATTGLLGLLSYLVVLGFMATLLILGLFQSDPADRPLLLALLTGWLTIPVTNFWGFSVVIVQILMFLLPALAVSIYYPEVKFIPIKSALSGKQIIGLLVFICLLGYLMFTLLRYWIADTRYAAGEKSLKYFTYTQDVSYILDSFQKLQEAYQLNPDDPPISSELGVISAYVSVLYSESDATAASQLAGLSLSTSKQAIEISPYHPNYYKSRARALRILSSVNPQYLSQADEVLVQAQKISPTDPRIPYTRGILARDAGNYPLAVSFFHEALKLKPDFADPQTQLQEIATLSAQPAH